MEKNELNQNVRTQINPKDEPKRTERNGYTQIKDLMNIAKKPEKHEQK